jgi:hypothetical protein
MHSFSQATSDRQIDYDGYLGLDNIEQSPEVTNVETAQRKKSVWVMFVMFNDWILE